MSDFLTKVEFSKQVEKNVLELGMSYMEAILHICDENSIDPEDVKKFVSRPIQEKLEGEAMRLNLIPRSNSLFFE